MQSNVTEVMEKMRQNLEYARKRDAEQRLEPLMVQSYTDLLLYTERDPEKLAEGCYKYIITCGAMSHTAFHTEAGLNRWLRKTGIRMGEIIEHLHNTIKLIGRYTEVSMSGASEKLNAFALKSRLEAAEVLSNGEFTRGFVKRGKRGNTIYYLNPNYPREKLPYKHE